MSDQRIARPSLPSPITLVLVRRHPAPQSARFIRPYVPIFGLLQSAPDHPAAAAEPLRVV